MIGELFTSVPGQGLVKFTGQSLRLPDQRRDDAFGILISDLDQHHVARMALDKCCDIAVPRSANQVALPVAWDRTIFNRCRSFPDGYGILDLAEPVPFQAGVPGAADRAFRSQVLKQLSFRESPPFGPTQTFATSALRSAVRGETDPLCSARAFPSLTHTGTHPEDQN